MPSEIEILMDLDPLALAKDEKALSAVIAYYRQNRAKAGPTGKLVKLKETIDLSAILKGLSPEKPKVVAPTGLRRV